MRPTARGTSTRSPRRPRSPARIEFDMDAAIESPLVYTGLGVRAEQKPGTLGTYIGDSPEEELVWSADGESAKLQLIAAVLDKKGRILWRDTQDMTEHRRISPSGNGGAGLPRLEIR